jgi:large subunit ribosomal protein L18
MKANRSRKKMQLVRHKRIRRRLQGTAERPRLAVFRSSGHIYAQVIDDSAGKTLASASTLQPDVRDAAKDKKPLERAKLVGESVAKKAQEAGVKQVVFDRGGFRFHGRVKALADSAREQGLEF